MRGYQFTRERGDCSYCTSGGERNTLCPLHYAEETGLYVLDWDCPSYGAARNLVFTDVLVRKGHRLQPVPGSTVLHSCEECWVVVVLPEWYR